MRPPSIPSKLVSCKIYVIQMFPLVSTGPMLCDYTKAILLYITTTISQKLKARDGHLHCVSGQGVINKSVSKPVKETQKKQCWQKHRVRIDKDLWLCHLIINLIGDFNWWLRPEIPPTNNLRGLISPNDTAEFINTGDKTKTQKLTRPGSASATADEDDFVPHLWPEARTE